MNASADEKEGTILDEESPEAKNGLFCFFDASRECGADCMAYTQEPTEAKALGRQQKNCLLLVSAERLGRYVGNIATDLHKMRERSATEAADRARLGTNPPLDPRGPKP